MCTLTVTNSQIFLDLHFRRKDFSKFAGTKATFSSHCFFFLWLFQTFSHCKIFAGFIFLPNMWTVQKESTLTKGHFFSLKDVRWTACCSIDHCGIAPSQCSWVKCTYGECDLKKTRSKQISGKVEEVDKFKYLSFCIFTKYNFKRHLDSKTLSVSNNSQDLLIERQL